MTRRQLIAVALTVTATLAVATGITVATRTTTAEAAVASTVEDEGADCPVPGLPDAGALPTNAKLPDPFKRLDEQLRSAVEWRDQINAYFFRKSGVRDAYGRCIP